MTEKRTRWKLLLFCLLIYCRSFLAQNTTVPVKVGVVLDMGSWVGKLGMSCLNMALSDFYATHPHYRTRLVFHTRDSTSDVVGAAAAALDLIKNVEVQAIIGPKDSMQSDFVIDLGNKSQVPIISFSATSPSLTSIRSPYFFRATHNDSSQVKAISAIVRAFGWREAVPIYVDNEYGEGVIPYLTDALGDVNTRIPYRSVISPFATDDEIDRELYKLMTMQTRVFIVHMTLSLGTRLFARAKEIGMMERGYVWIITDGMFTVWSSMEFSDFNSMQGVLGVRTYVPNSKELQNFRVRWKRKFQRDNPDIVDAGLNVFGLWAYDAAFALAIAVEKIGTTNFSFNRTVSNGLTDLNSLGVSENGPQLIQALSSTRFRGLSGEFQFVDGQLQSSIFQIFNVNGNGEKEIGFWTPDNGLIKKLNSSTDRASTAYSTSRENLGTIIWPGDSPSSPKGWDFPTNPDGKTLRIAIPVKTGFSEFVTVAKDPITGTTTPKGYCIDIFKAVVDALPYAVPYEIFPFIKPDGEMAGSYNDLVDQVYYRNYDAVVGDITIVANRSRYIDFTLPYTESGVSMVVPVIDNKHKNAWVFLKPLTWELWLTIACFFLFTGFVVWVLEHRINEDFRGPPSHQIGTSFWFSFSTMVFAHKERVVSNLARFVVIVWCFVVLILTQSYTASLTSLLTVQQLQPTVRDLKEILKRGESVGFQDGSFVEDILKEMQFDPTKIKPFNSTDELHQLFEKGSARGGISAAVDEIPYMKLFLARYCGKYTMLEPIFKTDGFGFVLPKGSPLTSDVSTAILTVTESDKMKEIENTWLKDETSCSDSSSTLASSNSLGVASFWGLFLIAGVSSVLALLIYVAMFLHEQRHVFLHSETEASIWKKMGVLLRIHDQKDLSSHTFKKRVAGITSPAEFSPSTHGPQSPSNYSVQTDPGFAFFQEQGRPATDHAELTLSSAAPPEFELANRHIYY